MVKGGVRSARSIWDGAERRGTSFWPDRRERWITVVTGISLAWLIWIACKALGFWEIVPLLGKEWAAVVTGVVGGLLWPYRPGRLWMVGVLVGLFCVACVVVITPVTRYLAMSLVRRDTVSSRNKPVADAVVVLGSGVSDAGLLNSEGVDRMLAGMALIRAGQAPVLVLSRPAEALRFGNRPDRDWQRFLSLLPEIPSIEVLDSTETTHDEALRLRQIARQRGWKSVFVVTSPLHTRRACASFERVGVHVICVPSESRDFALPDSRSAFERFDAFGMWLHETIGWTAYRLRGWV